MLRISHLMKTLPSLLSIILILNSSCDSSVKPKWEKRNTELIEQYGLTVKELPELPSSSVTPNLEVGTPANIQNLESVQLYPGVTAKIFWGNGNNATGEVNPDSKKTITELAFIPSDVQDRFYFLNIQLPHFECDAAPSRPILIKAV